VTAAHGDLYHAAAGFADHLDVADLGLAFCMFACIASACFIRSLKLLA